jgi:excisionase family DNA binding protein
MDPWRPVPDYAAIFGCSPEALYKACRRGDLPHIRVGRLVRVRESDVAQYVASSTQIAPTAKAAA